MFRILLMIRLDLAIIKTGHFSEGGHINNCMDTMLKGSTWLQGEGIRF